MRTLGVIGTLLAATTSMGQVFLGLGVGGPTNTSAATAISADGRTVVGGQFDIGGVPWRWSALTGRVNFGPVPAGFQFVDATDVSGDGSVAVGSMNDGAGLTTSWRWQSGGSVERVVGIGGGLTFGPFVSADGSTIVGTQEGFPLSARRWTQATGAQSLNPVTGVPIGQGSALVARAVTANGSLVAGTATAIYTTVPQPLSAFLPFRWTQGTGSVGTLDNGQFYLPTIGAGASDLSADGSVMVGYVGAGTWRWTVADGFSLVLNPAATAGSFLPKVSGDGSTIAYRHLLWTVSDGEVPLTTALTSAGCNFTGWSNVFATDVSFNGHALCGYGTNPTGQTEAWYATIPAPVSAPPLLAISTAASLRRRRA